MRMVAVSATLPNISDIAAFLDANEAHTFDESYRPVPLTLHVVGLGFLGDKSSNQFHFWNRLEKDVPNLIHRFSKGRPTIIFCHSKAETERLADILATANGIGKGPVNTDIAGQSRVQKLQRVIMQGIAYHHAGLELDDRRMVERAFIGNKIRALCATSTLAMGVNLPAHLVIIKGTKAWRGGYQDLDQASLLQMIGRAGRPGFDTSGTAVIMTDNASKARFEQLATSGLEPANSKLLSKLVEVINTEISQLVITSTETALNWIKGTLFFVQLNKDPMAHGLQSASPHGIDSHLLQLLGSTIRRLQRLGAKVSDDGYEITPVPANHIMSQQLVTCEAMELFVGLPFDASQCQILKALTEIEDIHRPVRRSEKKALNETHKMIKYKLDGAPSKVRVQKPPEKALVLLQAGIGQIYLEDYALRKEMSAMVDYSSRMLVAVEEYSVRGSMFGQVAVQSLKLRRSLATSLWTASNGALNQLMGVGQKTTTSLKFNGITTFEDVIASTEEVIEKAAQRAAPFGAKLRSAVSEILRSTLKVSGEIVFTPGSIIPKAIICCLETNKDAPSLHGGSEVRSHGTPAVTYTLIVSTDRPGGCLIYQKNISSPGTYKVASPATFGKITMQLVASMVGLDGTYIVLTAKIPGAQSFSLPIPPFQKKSNSKAMQS
jgi:ATP-dependent DNA helicase HFM1/MER3